MFRESFSFPSQWFHRRSARHYTVTYRETRVCSPRTLGFILLFTLFLSTSTITPLVSTPYHTTNPSKLFENGGFHAAFEHHSQHFYFRSAYHCTRPYRGACVCSSRTVHFHVLLDSIPRTSIDLSLFTTPYRTAKNE